MSPCGSTCVPSKNVGLHVERQESVLGHPVAEPTAELGGHPAHLARRAVRRVGRARPPQCEASSSFRLRGTVIAQAILRASLRVPPPAALRLSTLVRTPGDPPSERGSDSTAPLRKGEATHIRRHQPQKPTVRESGAGPHRWAVAMELRPDNPCDRIGRVLGPQNDVVRHMTALPHRDVAAALEKVRASDSLPVVKLAFEFLVLTAARWGEVRWAVWPEMDHGGGGGHLPAHAGPGVGLASREAGREEAEEPVRDGPADAAAGVRRAGSRPVSGREPAYPGYNPGLARDPPLRTRTSPALRWIARAGASPPFPPLRRSPMARRRPDLDGGRGRARAHPAGLPHWLQPQPDRSLGRYAQAGHRGRRGDRSPDRDRAGARQC